MSTPNFSMQERFDVYISDMTCPIIDEDGNETDDYEFDEFLFDEVKFQLDKLNEKLTFFEIGLAGGYYYGVQSYVKPRKLTYYDNSFDLLDYYDDIDGKEIYQYFGYNKHVLKQKILKEIKFINEKLLPQLKEWTFVQIKCVGIFSNGEAVYEKVGD